MLDNILPFRGVTPKISTSAFIAPNAMIIGDVEIAEGSSIWYNCLVRGDINVIRIGKNTNIQDGTVIHVDRKKYGAFIGDNVTVGHMALIHACTLENNSMVGMSATVMDGAVVESGALVAAGSLVAPGKIIPAGQMWAGTPARYVRDLKSTDKEMLADIWPGYRDLAGEYQQNGFGSD